jgi:hypothetical protein
MTGTTLAMLDLLSGNISAFKWEEIALVLSVGPFTGTQVVKIIHYYFPKLKVTPSVANRWAGRGRILFQHLLQPLFDNTRNIKDYESLQVFSN